MVWKERGGATDSGWEQKRPSAQYGGLTNDDWFKGIDLHIRNTIAQESEGGLLADDDDNNDRGSDEGHVWWQRTSSDPRGME